MRNWLGFVVSVCFMSAVLVFAILDYLNPEACLIEGIQTGDTYKLVPEEREFE